MEQIELKMATLSRVTRTLSLEVSPEKKRPRNVILNGSKQDNRRRRSE